MDIKIDDCRKCGSDSITLKGKMEGGTYRIYRISCTECGQSIEFNSNRSNMSELIIGVWNELQIEERD